MRLSLFAVALATGFLAVSAASLGFLARQTSPEDAIGSFKLSVFIGAQCFQRVAHNATVDDDLRIAHNVMSIDDIACTSEGAMQVYTNPEEASAAVDEQTSKDLITTISAAVSDALYGVEMSARVCGNRRFPPKTLVVIFTPEERVVIGGFVTYFPTRRYMIIDDPSKTGTCVYAAERRPVAVPVSPSPAPASPEPSPSPAAATPMASVAPSVTPDAPSGGVVPVPVPGGQASASASAVASPTPLLVGVPSDLDPNDTEEETSPEDDDDDDPICFPAEALVEIEDGSVKRMDQVQIGDRVKVGSGMFSEVFMFTHKVSKRVSPFVKLDLASGASISATSGHYLYLNGRLAAARTAKVGDVMELGNGARTTVQKVSVVKNTGLYNPQTLHGDIVVNEVRASTFTTAIEAGTAQAMLAPLRMMFDVFGWSTSVFNGGFDLVNKVVPKGQLVL